MFDIAAARKDGIPDQAIVDHLREAGDKGIKFNYDAAIKDGVSPTQILDHLAESPNQPKSLVQDISDAASAAASQIGAKSNVDNDVTRRYLMRLGLTKEQQDAEIAKQSAGGEDRTGVSSVLRDIQPTAQGVAGVIGSPVTGANRNLVSRPLSNATGIPIDKIEDVEGAAAAVLGGRPALNTGLARSAGSDINTLLKGRNDAAKSLVARMEGRSGQEAVDVARKDISNDLDRTVDALRQTNPNLPNSVENTLGRAADGTASANEIAELAGHSPEAAKLADEAGLARDIHEAGQPKQGNGFSIGGALGALGAHSAPIRGLLALFDYQGTIGGKANSVGRIVDQLTQRYGGGTENQPMQVPPAVQAAQAQIQRQAQIDQHLKQVQQQQYVAQVQAAAKTQAEAQQQAAIQAKATQQAKEKGFLKDVEKLAAAAKAEQQARRLQAQEAQQQMQARAANARLEAQGQRQQVQDATQLMQARRANDGLLQPNEIPNVLPSDIPAFLPASSGKTLPPGPLTRDAKGRFQKRHT